MKIYHGQHEFHSQHLKQIKVINIFLFVTVDRSLPRSRYLGGRICGEEGNTTPLKTLRGRLFRP